LSALRPGGQFAAMHMLAAPWIFAALSFLLAGSVKGIAGMGLPTVAMGLLGLQLPAPEAAALVVFPSLVTNAAQYLSGAGRISLLRRMWPMLAAICVATWAASGLMVLGGMRQATAALGATLCAYGVFGLTSARIVIRPGREAWLSPVIGAATGIVTGATGVFVIPAVPYLQALGLQKDTLVQALGLSFSVSTLSLAAGLASYGALHVTAAGASLACVVPACAGMVLGRKLRAGITQATFRLVFFLALIALGAALIVR